MELNIQKSIFLVVLYNKEVKDSNTINTLIAKGLHDVKIVIHNNGPLNISLSINQLEDFASKGIKVQLINSISNKPLAILYNDFISSQPGYSKYIILDDDSEITASFLEATLSDQYDLEVPKIISRHDNVTYYPISDGSVVTNDGFIPVKGTHSIGSGLIITRKLVGIFERNNLNLFDEHYALYGVDISLFRRMWKLADLGEIIKIRSSSTLIHSLSRIESAESEFRRLERAMDFAISVRRYPTARLYLSFCKKTLTNLSRFRFKDVYLMMSCFISGRHPRCRDWSN